MSADPLAAMSPEEIIKTLKVFPKPPEKPVENGQRKRPQGRDRVKRVAASQIARLDLLIQATKATRPSVVAGKEEEAETPRAAKIPTSITNEHP